MYELYHHGVKGMKWGVRRYQKHKDQQKKQQDKLAKIASDPNNNRSDVKIAKAGQGSTSKKVMRSMTKAVIGQVLEDMMVDGTDYSNMSKADLEKRAIRIAKRTAVDYTKTELLAKSVANKYDDDGVKDARYKERITTREEVYNFCYNTAVASYPLASRLAGVKYTEAKAKRAANEARFNAWGGNILESNYDDIVGLSPDEYRFK